MKTVGIFVFFSLLAIPIFAQNNAKKTAADKLYEHKGYAKYLEAQANNKAEQMDISTMIKVADSYRKTGAVGASEYLYALIIEQKEEPIYKLYYAQALHSNGKYLEAYQYYTAYQKEAENDHRGKILADGCMRVGQFKALSDIVLENEKVLNSSQLDFSPSYYQNGLVFSSTRGRKFPNNTDKWTNDKFIDLYFSGKDINGLFQKTIEFSKELNSKYHEGPLTFTRDGQTVYFTRNNFLNGKLGKSNDHITKLKIYSAKLVNNRWTEIQEFQYNNKERDVCHPTLSSNGKMLVFSQDAPDGQGGQDLYVCYWLGNQWTAPKNLGKDINTKGNEVFPFLHPNGTLYYASNGLGGLGGLDIFAAEQIQQGQDSIWVSPTNLGTPFNSKADDFGLILNAAENDGYLTSNREGGLGNDDIYHFHIKNEMNMEDVFPKASKIIQICVFDNQTNKRIEGAEVAVYEGDQSAMLKSGKTQATNGNIILKLQPIQPNSNEYLLKLENSSPDNNQALNTSGTNFNTNKQGVFSYTLTARKKYTLVATKAGYQSNTDILELPSLDGLEEYCIGLNGGNVAVNNATNKTNPLGTNPTAAALIDYLKSTDEPDSKHNPSRPTLVGMAINKEYNRPLPNTKVTLLNRCTGEETEIALGSNADFSDIALECGCDYVLKARKENFAGVNKIIELSNLENCNQPIKALMALAPKFDKTGEAIELGGDIHTEGLHEGDLIELKNVFYDFDEYYIRPDAAKDLDQLVSIMKRFPDMEIELSSHTDSRADKDYNITLSTNRAKSAREYLIQKGIDGGRIEAVGYGETRLRNKCKNDVPCSEFDHQRNRRTEVFVTKFAGDTKIQYIDNAPTVIDPKDKD